MNDPLVGWLRPEWRASATTWIDRELERLGIVRTGEIEQPHVQWWSTVLRVPTADGTLWFKACQPEGVFEARLTPLLATLRPRGMVALLATDPQRGWTLARDAGARLRELAGDSAPVEHWALLLPRYAELQIELAGRREELLALGVPDLSLSVLSTELAATLSEAELLLLGTKHGVSAEQRGQLVDGLPAFVRLCTRLTSLGIPETLQHDDLHDGNAFLRDGEYVFFDWGDSCISHPFHTLVVTLRALAYRLKWEPGGPEITRLRDAYLEPWRRFAPTADLAAAAELARQTGTIQRAMAWRRGVASMPPAVRAEYIDSIPYGLRLYLLDRPFGTWDDGSF